ncbi:MAG TPA: DnaJ C-terminal domain-containing protein [Ktedonobacteraceae bacterium]|nr:DnaJ C-terminal domain-containing protein [Ktedonobacteraceae bacterium]
MMCVIISGRKQQYKVMGQVLHICSQCNRQAYHTLVRSQRWFTLYFVPIIPLRKTTTLRCNLCGFQSMINNKEADAWLQQQARTGTPASDVTGRGADIRYDLTISFEEAVFGCQKEIELPRWELCPTCRGTGMLPDMPASSCKQCAGQGHINLHRRLLVNIPAGVDNGINVRVIGEGHASPRGGPSGNLYVVLTVQPHPFFKRSGYDIIYELPVNRTQATLGAEVAVPLLDGKAAMLKIPPNTQDGRTFRLKGMGVPSVHSDARGDQQVIVKVV